jgi:hypothetical protein
MSTKNTDAKVSTYRLKCMRWLLTNWGNPWSVHRTRKQAIEAACEATGEPWEKTRRMFEIRKCEVRVKS